MDLKTVMVLLVVIASFQYSDGIAVKAVLAVAELTVNVVKGLFKLNKIVNQNVNFDNIPHPLFEKTERNLLSGFDMLSQKIDINENISAKGGSMVASVLQRLPEKMRFELRLKDLLDFVTRININHKRMQYYVSNRDGIEEHTLIDFAKKMIDHSSDSTVNLLERLYAFFVSEEQGVTDTGILNLISNILTEVEGDMRCDSGQSPQQVLYNLYNAIALTELKGYSMIQFSYMVLKLYNEGNYTKEAVQQQERFESRTNSAVKAIKEAMQNASRIHYRCDPRRHVKGKTYEEITQLIQGYIQNEVDLNPDGTCRENCAEYKYTKSHGCYQNLYCRQQRTCKGKILNCQFIDSDMWICPASPQSNRRYEYVEYENKRTLGRNKGCVRGSTKVDSWWRWLFWHCSYCFCLCDEAGPTSDRFFNMRSVIANITQNRVVTGLRFTKQNRIIHLQIQEGQLLPYGKINQTTVRWVPVDAYKITDYGVHNEKDYHTMSWEKRAIDLDDLLADDGFLVTGVRFKLIGSHLNFEIYMTPFDYKNGVLLDPTNKSVWKDNPNTDSALKNPRKRLRLQSPDIPTQSPNPSVIDSETDQYVEFTNSDMDRDAAQTTVPFIDVQEVESLQPVPLSGAGIHHKGQVYFGGFVAPKIITYDYSKHLKPVFPEHDEEPEVN